MNLYNITEPAYTEAQPGICISASKIKLSPMRKNSVSIELRVKRLTVITEHSILNMWLLNEGQMDRMKSDGDDD